MARKSNPSLGAHADAIENMARDVAREHSISLSEARSRVRSELQRERDRALSTTSVEGRRRPNPIPLEPPAHVANDLAKLSDHSLRANHDRALEQIHTGAPAKRDASNRLVCWSLWEAQRRGLQFDRSTGAAAPAARASNPVAGNYDFVDDDGKMAPMHPRSQNPHGHYLDVVLGDGDTIFIDNMPVGRVGDGVTSHVSDQSDTGFVLHLAHHGRQYAGQVLYGLPPMQVRLVTQPHPSRRVLGMPHPGHRHANPHGNGIRSNVCEMRELLTSHGYPATAVEILTKEGMGPYELEHILKTTVPGGIGSLEFTHGLQRGGGGRIGNPADAAPCGCARCMGRAANPTCGCRHENPVGTRNSAMGTRVTRTRHLNESGEYTVRHWVHGEMIGDYATPLNTDAIAVQRYLTGEHHGHPRPDIEKFLGERQGPQPCRDDGRFCGGEKAPSKRKSNPATPKTPKPKTDWNQTKLSEGDKSFVRYVMGNMHVGTTEEDVVREWAQRKNLRDHLDTPLVHALINQALDAHWENILVYESVTSMRKLPRVRPSKGQPLPVLPPARKQTKEAAKPKTRALPASKAPPMLPPAPHDRGDNPITHWKY